MRRTSAGFSTGCWEHQTVSQHNRRLVRAVREGLFPAEQHSCDLAPRSNPQNPGSPCRASGVAPVSAAGAPPWACSRAAVPSSAFPDKTQGHEQEQRRFISPIGGMRAEHSRVDPTPSERTDPSTGASLRHGFCLAETAHGVRLKAACPGKAPRAWRAMAVIFFLATFTGRDMVRALLCADLHFSQVSKQKDLQRQQTVLSISQLG